MSVYFEAVVVAADQPALVRLLESLSDLDDDPFAPITLELHRVTDRGFVIFAWRAGAKRPQAAEEVEDLADELSLKLGTAVALHYDDQVGVKHAMLSGVASRRGTSASLTRSGFPTARAGSWLPTASDTPATRSRTTWSATAFGTGSTRPWRRRVSRGGSPPPSWCRWPIATSRFGSARG
jgi:hypothetical protein